MAFLESALGSLLYNIVLTILMVYGFKMLLNSAKESLKRTGGKWRSVIDEGLIAVAGFVILIILWNMGPVGLINEAKKWVAFIWGLLVPILRNLGLPV